MTENESDFEGGDASAGEPGVAEPVIGIRAATEIDIPGLVASSTALFTEDAGARDPGANAEWPRQYGRERFTDHLGDPRSLLLVADCAGEVVGHLTGLLSEPTPLRGVRVASLVSLYVRPALRGAGTGSRLLAGFAAWAKRSGAEVTEVTAYASNRGAVRFYERHGFKAHEVTLTGRP